MNYLLDTNVWLHGYAEPERLPQEIQWLLNGDDEPFGLSAISLWEIAKKSQIGKLKLNQEIEIWLKNAIASRIRLLPLAVEVVSDAMRLPNFPNRDPVDELIVATARVHHLELLTTDTKLKNYRHAKIRYFKPVELNS